jgi:hypothetical protein
MIDRPRLVLPAVPADATPQQSAALCGAGVLDELDRWEFWLRHEGALELADDVAIVRTRLYLHARSVIESDTGGQP